MKREPIYINLNERPRFGVGTVIAIYGNAARNLQGLGRCIAAAAISGSFGPFSKDGAERAFLYMPDTLDNELETEGAVDAILDMAESSSELHTSTIEGESLLSCLRPWDIRNYITDSIKAIRYNGLIISGAEDIPEDVKSLAEVRAALRWFKRIAQDINGFVILEFGIKPSLLIKNALIDNCNYAFLTEEDESQRGRITVTATRWEGDPIPTMHIDTDPEGAPTITIDEAEEE